MKKVLAALLAFSLFLLHSAPAGDAGWEAQRKEILDRPRGVIYNTDGCDAIYFGLRTRDPNAPLTKESFKQERFVFCLGGETTTLSYCLTSGGTGQVLYDSKCADTYLKFPGDNSEPSRNVIGDLIKMGTNPLKLAEEFCRENQLEFFACLRMNDNHDAGHTAARPSPFWSRFKQEHPDALMGSEQKRTPFCSWTAIDFNHPAIHKYYHDVIGEVAQRFDVDGFEYDFMRHAQLFRSVANGGHASQAELDAMTGLMRDLRQVTETAGHAKGRPIMIAIRVPDSVEYCRAIGIDIERWLSEKLVDILITTSYFQFNPWKYTVDLAHKYGAKAYASVDESRIERGRTPLPLGTRGQLRCYQAQVLSAMRQGCDGLYVFNFEYGGLPPRVYSSIDYLQFKDKLYHATYRGSGGYLPGGFLRGGELYYNLPVVEPGNHAAVPANGTLDIPIYIGDDLQYAASQGRPAMVTAQLRSAAGCDFALKVNGKPAALVSRKEDIYTYDVAPESILCGENVFSVSPSGYQGGLSQVVAAKGNALLTGRLRGQWRRFYLDGPESEKILDGAYRLQDSISSPHHAAALWHPLPGRGASQLLVKVSVKLLSASDDNSAVVRIANGLHVERIAFLPGQIKLCFAGKSAKFDTTGAFHDYEFRLDGDRILVKADGKELLQAPLTGTTTDPKCDMVGYTESIPGLNDRGVAIGSISGPGKGAMLFKDFLVQQDTLALQDFAVAISYAEPPDPELLALRDAKIQPMSTIEVRNGAIVMGQGVTNDYKKESIIPDEDGVLLLHRRRYNEYAQFNLAANVPLDNPPRILLSEFTVRALENGGEGKPPFIFCIAPVRPGKAGSATWEIDIRVATNAIHCDSLRGRIDYNQIDLGKDNTFRIAMDTTTGKAVVWCSGKLLLSGTISKGAGRNKPFLFCGDGSGGVEGIARFLGAVVGVPKE